MKIGLNGTASADRCFNGLPALIGLFALIAATLGFAPSASALPPGNCTYGACAPSSTVVGPTVSVAASIQTSDLVADRISTAIEALQNVGGFGSNLAYAGPSQTSAASAAIEDSLLRSSYADEPQVGRTTASIDSLQRRNVVRTSDDKKWQMWMSFSGTRLFSSQSNAEYRGTLATAIGGLDYRLLPTALLGVTTGYQHLDMDTRFNAGTLRNDGFVLGTYGALVLSPIFSIDGQVAHTWLNYDESRPGVSGNFRASRWSTEIEGRAQKTIDAWVLKSSLGYAYTIERQNSYVESNGSSVGSATAFLGQFRLKGQVGYKIPLEWGTVTPYVAARLEFTNAQSAAAVIDALGTTFKQGHFGTTFETGVDAAVGTDLFLSLRLKDTVDYNDHSAYGVLGSVRYRF